MKIGPTVRSGRRIEKKKVSQDRIEQDSQKSHKGVIFHLFGRSPTEPIFTKNCAVVAVPDEITCANFCVVIFSGYDFTGGRISRFPSDFFVGLTTVQRYCVACDGYYSVV